MQSLFFRFCNKIVLGNYFIALCALSLVFTTMMMNGFNISITPFSVFLVSSTFLHYNFHKMSGQFDFDSMEAFKFSIHKIRFSLFDNFMYSFAVVTALTSLVFMSGKLLSYLLPSVLFPLLYTIPLIQSAGKKIRLSQLPYVKTPLIALTWGYTTVFLPLVEQNIDPSSSLALLQMASRTLFVFALCIPFEIRDMDKDRRVNVRTLPVLFGVKVTGAIGIISLIIEIFSHHSMITLTEYSILALDISSIIALLWIFMGIKIRNIYFYKFFVDGTMLVRFLFIYIAINHEALR